MCVYESCTMIVKEMSLTLHDIVSHVFTEISQILSWMVHIHVHV